MSLSKITPLLKKGGFADADRVVTDYRIVTSHEVSAGGASKTKIYGVILHISKAASVNLSKS